MKIDITTGDIITPAAIRYDFPFVFEEKTVSVMAYTLETVLAENMKRLSAETLELQGQGIIMIYILFTAAVKMWFR